MNLLIGLFSSVFAVNIATVIMVAFGMGKYDHFVFSASIVLREWLVFPLLIVSLLVAGLFSYQKNNVKFFWISVLLSGLLAIFAMSSFFLGTLFV